MSLQSVLVQTGYPDNKASPGTVLRTGAHKGSLGTMLALGSYTPHWRSPGEPGMRLALSLHSVLVRLPGEPGNKASHELAIRTGAQLGSLGTSLAQGLHSVLGLTRGAWEQG